MKKNKKVFAILTLVAFMITLLPVMAFAASGDYDWKTKEQTGGINIGAMSKLMYDEALRRATTDYTQEQAEALATELKGYVDGLVNDSDAEVAAQIAADVKEVTGKDVNGGSVNPPQPTTGEVSVDASIIATIDEDANCEAAPTASQSNFGDLIDTKYAELQVVLRAANNAAVSTGGTFYVWAEESGKSRQASDALVLNQGTRYNADFNVYRINANASVTELKAAFLRNGSFNLKASIKDPTVDANASTGLLASNIATFKTVSNKNAITANAVALKTRDFKIDVEQRINNEYQNVATRLGDGEDTDDKYITVAADTVATTKVRLTVFKDATTTTGLGTYPVRLSTNSSNIELDKTSLTTDYNGQVTFNVAGIREGEYKIYVTIGDYESTILVRVGATSASDIQLIKFPSNPIATDTEVADYKDIFRFQLIDANGNIVQGQAPRGAKYASIASQSDSPEKTAEEKAKYATIVSAPTANKVKDADLRLWYVTGKDYYTLTIDNNKAFTAEGDYEIRVVLDNGKSATLNFSVKKFDKAVSLHIEYPTTAVELNTTTDVPDIYFLDASNVMKKANNRVNVAAQGYAVADVKANGRDAGVLRIKNDEKYVGQTVTVTAISDKENLVASTTLTVADEAREVKLATTRGAVNANNRVNFSVVDSQGNVVALGTDATVEVSAVVTNTGDADAKVSYSVAGSSESDLKAKGAGVINLSSNKQTTATVNIIVKVTKKTGAADTSGTNNTGLSTTYYSGTETFTFGAEADKSVVMTIGSKEIVAQNVPVTIDVAPFIQDNRTYVPFRALVEAFGAEVDYNADNNTVTTKLDGKTVVLTVGSTVLTVNDETVTMDVAPFIVDDRVVVPVRFVGEAFGFTVEATQDADTGATASVVFYQK